MPTFLRLFLSGLLAVCLINYQLPEARAWSLKTHVWIAQQVLNDAADGSVVINGVPYQLPADVSAALLAHPDRYRMGNLGPDVFPDPLVGQMTTHPGIEGGWQTDDWLKHVLNSAKNDEELAFSYGFIGHAAGDIFAHSYVNAYAGDIFFLTDGETEVELRHFVLEKYIESLTPHPADNSGVQINLESDLKSATSFLRDTLILHDDVSRQNLKSKAGGHLTAMHEVRSAVRNLQRETQNVIEQLTTWAAEFFQKQIQLQIDLATAKHVVEAAKASLIFDEAQLEARRAAHKAALDALAEAKRIVANNPGLITAQQQLWIAQAKVAADAAALAAQVAANAVGAIAGLEGEIGRWADRLGDLVCNVIGGVLRECRTLREAISRARNEISVWRRAKEAADAGAADAARLRDQFKEELDGLKAELDRAEQGLANGIFDAALLAAETDLRIQGEIVEAKKKLIEEAEKLRQKVADELNKITAITDELKRAIDRYNPLTLLISKWLGDIDVATEEYIKASERAGFMMLKAEGNPLGEYTEWWTCFGSVFQAVPKEVGQAGCLAKNFLKDVDEEVGRVIDDLPEIVRWIVAPTREIRKEAEKRVRPELEKATFQVIAFLTNKSLAEFLQVLMKPEYATREKLVEVYSRDDSVKKLIVFPDVASVVEQDLQVVDGKLDPEKFPALRHAVTLAKMSLLAPAELDRLVINVSGMPTVVPPGGLFRNGGGRYSLLLSAVRSIDGNHQWQGYGLPYPKRIGAGHLNPSEFPYGRDGLNDPSKGIPIWSSALLREKVFAKIFPDGVIGSLGDHAELQWKNYRFPACKAHPFPHTQDPFTKKVVDEDATCSLVSSPNSEPISLSTATANEYQERYFECEKPIVGPGHWTVVGSYRGEKSARLRAAAIRTAFPDMEAEAWRPVGSNRYWTVMIAGCTTREKAVEARDVAVSRGIAFDAFIWRPRLPWEPTADVK
jgi:uncharacterized protein YciI